MDLAEFKRRFDKSREVTEEVDGRTFTLRLPTRAVAMLVVESEAAAGRAVYQLLVESIVAWKGVKVADLSPEDPEAHEPLPCTADTVPMLLDTRLDLTAVLSQRLLEALRRRSDSLEAARKN